MFSLSFVYLFLPFSMAVYYITPNKFKNIVLFLISAVFYLLIEPSLFVFMFFSLSFDYTAVQIMKCNNYNQTVRMSMVSASIIKTIISIILLGNDAGIITYAGVLVYTLTATGYVIDAYDYRAPYEDSFINFSLMCIFFGKIYVGPLLTYNNIMPQIKKRKASLSNISTGVILFINGLAKKILLADNIIKVYINLKNIPTTNMSIISVWAMIISIAFSIYFNLSSLCDMARGIGKIFGFDFPKNFYYPYQAKTATEFFSRFNMSIVEFIKRYVCFDLIGYKNYKLIGSLQLILVGILSGLWFGINIKFAIWGLYLVILVLLEKHVYGKYMKKIPSLILRFTTFIVILISFTILASNSLNEFLFYIKSMFGFNISIIPNDEILYILNSNYIIIIVCFILCTSIVDMGLRFVATEYPRFSEIFNVIFNIMLLIATTAFML